MSKRASTTKREKTGIVGAIAAVGTLIASVRTLKNYRETKKKK